MMINNEPTSKVNMPGAQKVKNPAKEKGNYLIQTIAPNGDIMQSVFGTDCTIRIIDLEGQSISGTLK